jgi:hypothetical protein
VLPIDRGFEGILVSRDSQPTLDQALALARHLSPRDRARLIARIAEELVEAPPVTSPDFALPMLSGGVWSDDLPLSRKDLYSDDERC